MKSTVNVLTCLNLIAIMHAAGRRSPSGTPPSAAAVIRPILDSWSGDP